MDIYTETSKMNKIKNKDKLDNIFFEIEMYHDAYETRLGEGFYPSVTPQENFSPIIVAFENSNKTWIQYITSNSTDNNIKG